MLAAVAQCALHRCMGSSSAVTQPHYAPVMPFVSVAPSCGEVSYWKVCTRASMAGCVLLLPVAGENAGALVDDAYEQCEMRCNPMWLLLITCLNKSQPLTTRQRHGAHHAPRE
jgi:hypothetical protein